MVSITDLSGHHGSEASANRLKQRRRAEWRLKAYGIIAIFIAGAALVTLLSTVVGKAVGAFTANYVTIEVPLLAEEIDPDGTGDPAVIGKANFTGVVKDTLKEAFPQVSGRQGRRDLYDIVSSGNAFEIRRQVIDDPSLIGETISYPFLASDVADLYLKGEFGDLTELDVQGQLSFVIDDDDVTLTSDADDFGAALESLKENLLTTARQVRVRAQYQENGRVEFDRRAEVAETEEDREANATEALARAAARDTFLAEADALETRAATEGGTEALDKKVPSILIRVGGGWIKMDEVSMSSGKGTVISPIENAETFAPSEWRYYVSELPEVSRKVSDTQIMLLETLREDGQIESKFNTIFFSSGDSREPELAGIWGAIVGSFWTMVVTFGLAFPIGVLAAIYLEEFAPKNRITDLIEVNINNLAAVPSIVFGLLGLAVFLGVFGVPRSAPLAGGIVLALMTLPTIIIASRAAIRAVPPSIRDAALGIGASKIQSTFHHVLPLAMPGILTGSIIGMAQALGETAPLIMIGMVAFIVDIPTGILDSSSVLPVQIFRWSDFPERAFEARTAAAICVLLVFLIIMNAIAVFLRKRFERRW